MDATEIAKLAHGLLSSSHSAIDVVEQQAHACEPKRHARVLCRVMKVPHALLDRGQIAGCHQHAYVRGQRQHARQRAVWTILRVRATFRCPPDRWPNYVDQFPCPLPGGEHISAGELHTNAHRQDVRGTLVSGVSTGQIALCGLLNPALPQENPRQRGLGTRPFTVTLHTSDKHRSTH